SAHTASLEGLIDGQTAHAHCRHRRITRKSLGHVRRQIDQRDARRSQSVIARNAVTVLLNRYKAGGHASTDVLRDLLMKVAVKRRGATAKRATIPCRIAGHEPQCHLAQYAPTMATCSNTASPGAVRAGGGTGRDS